MKTITSFVLRRPVTVLMGILCLIVFGYQSVASARLELSPEMETPMLMVSTTYSGASPEDVDELVTRVIEDRIGSLSGVKTISSTSSEGRSMVMLQFEYGTDTDDAYDDLKKRISGISNRLPDDAGEPSIMQMDMNAQPDITLTVDNPSKEDLYTYVSDDIVPEFEKMADASEVSVRGGSNKYVKIELIEEKVAQYGMTMQQIAQDIAASSLSYPSGETYVGSQELSMSTRMKYDTLERLKDIPLTTKDGSTVYLEDVAEIYLNQQTASSVARYNGNPTVSLSITKQQSATAVELSNEAKQVIETLKKNDPDLNIRVVRDSAEQIMDSLTSVFQTLVLAVVISMVVIWLFFGDLKASLIVGSSIPFSILTALILMTRMGYSLNVITLSALTLGVGMMVDNSIVVLESCFRAAEKRQGGFLEFRKEALEGTNQVSLSVMGSTLTTCVVFLPLAMIAGMAGQMFRPLGFTIVFCMLASLISAISIVPLCYMMYRPVERDRAPFSAPVHGMQRAYRRWMKRILPRKWTVMGISAVLLAVAVYLGMNLGTELMASDDQGEIRISITTRPGLRTEETDKIARQIEDIISVHPDLDSWMTQFGGGARGASASITAYLKDDRAMTTAEISDQWSEELSDITNCDISVSASSSMSMMSGFRNSYSVILKGTNYDEVKEVAAKVTEALKGRSEVTRVTSSTTTGAPVLEIQVDALKAKAAGITAAQVGSAISNRLNGVTATEIDVEGESLDVKVEYPDGEYESLDQVEGIVLTTPSGGAVALTDVAEIKVVESPSSISRQDKQYQVTVNAQYTAGASQATRQILQQEVVQPLLTGTVTIGVNSRDRSQQEEFASLYTAIGTAVFLVFVVMAAQFESIRYSVMVMTTIPFSLIGSFGLLWLLNLKISMVSLIGFLMLSGTVVNNGILFVDAANQNRGTMDLDTALIEAGATRIRPILMTTMTTVLAMFPMALALGNAGSTTQGLAVTDIGGLTASTVLALLMLPVYYRIMSRKPKNETAVPVEKSEPAESQEQREPAVQRETEERPAAEAVPGNKAGAAESAAENEKTGAGKETKE